MKNKTLTFLGNDSGFGKKNNSAYIEKEDKLILIDCGFSVFEIIKEKFEFNKYKEIEVIITHLHNDHAGSLSQLILYLWFIYKKSVTIFSKCSRIKDYLEITGTPKDAYILKNASKNIEFIKTEHVKYLDSYGFKLNIENKNIIYTGDTNEINAFLPYIKNANELYIDVSRYGGAYIKIDDILNTLEEIEKNGTNIYLMHMDDKEYIKSVIKNKDWLIDVN